MIEWEVYLSGGRVLTSQDCTWDDVPGDILVVRMWGPTMNRILWGQDTYGHPGTERDSIIVSDEEFADVLQRAHAQRTPPSERMP